MPGARATLLTRTLDLSVIERSASLDATGTVATSAVRIRVLIRQVVIAATADIASARVFWTTFTRQASLDAASAVASTAAFYSILTRQAVIGAIGDIATAHTFWTILVRSAALNVASSISTASVFWSMLVRQAAINATAQVATAAVFWTTFLRSAQIDGVGSVVAASKVAHLHRRLAAIAATATLTSSGQWLDCTPTAPGLLLAHILGDGSLVAPYHAEVAEFNVSSAAVIPTDPAGHPLWPMTLVNVSPSLAAFDQGQVQSIVFPKVELAETLGLSASKRTQLHDAIFAELGLDYSITSTATLGELVGAITAHLMEPEGAGEQGTYVPPEVS